MTGLHITEHQLHKRTNCAGWPVVIFSLLFLAGSSRILLSGFEENVQVWLVCLAICAGVVCLVRLLACSRWKNWSFLIVTAISVLIFLTGMPQLRNGIGVLANKWLHFLTGKTGKIYLDFSTDGQTGVYAVYILVLGYISAVLILTVMHRRIWFETMLLIVCLVGCGCGFMKADAAVLAMVTGYIVLVFLRKVQGREFRVNRITISFLFGIVVVGLVIAGGMGYLICSHLPMEKMKIQMLSELHEKKFDGGEAVLSDGNLINPGSFSENDETALEITFEGDPQKLYLRGMTADTYTGSAWKSLTSEAYQDGADLFYWLHKEQFYGQCSVADAMKLSDDTLQPESLKIKNVSACSKYRYLPYGLAMDNSLNEKQIGDDRNLAERETENLSIAEGSLPQWYQTALWLSENQTNPAVADFLAKEESYRQFVYKYDLQLTDTAIKVCEQVIGETEQKESYTLSEILELIRNTLDEKLEYRTDTVTYNGANDFFQYTMEQSKSGYSVQYATAATLLLRYFGVPSRYVEGYYLSSQDAEKVQAGEAIAITKAQAHAWTEYYLDGVGWMPFEVTPGYVDEEENQQVAQLLADGEGEQAGQLSRENSLTYTPPAYQQDHETAPDQTPYFRFRIRYVISIILLILAALIVAATIWILHRRWKLNCFWKRMRGEDRRAAVAELYGYSRMLITRCQLTPGEQEKQMRQINLEARFSRHEIEETQVREMLQYTEALVRKAKGRHGIWKRFKDHYLLWIYR